MAKKKIHFSLRDISIFQDDVNEVLVERLSSDENLRPSASLEVGYEFDFKNNSIRIDCGSILSLGDDIVYCLRISNFYYVTDITDVAEPGTEVGGIKINNTSFFHYLIDVSISQLRGIQSIKLKGRLKQVRYAPFIKAKDIIQPKNLISTEILEKPTHE